MFLAYIFKKLEYHVFCRAIAPDKLEGHNSPRCRDSVSPDVSTKYLAPFSSDMKFRAITGWALLAKQREYWPPILDQGALIPQSFILPSGFLPEGEEGGRAVRNVVKHEFPLLSGTYTVPKSFTFSPSVYLQALDVPETSCSFQYRHKAPCNHY